MSAEPVRAGAERAEPGGAVSGASAAREPGTLALLTLDIRYEEDVVVARQRARQVAQLLGFDAHDQTRIATALGELARNAYEYARGGRATFEVRDSVPDGRQRLVVRVSDEGPGIADLRAVLDGRFESRTGTGLGLVGARRLSDHFQVDSSPGKGTVVEIGRALPRAAARIGPHDLKRIADALASRMPRSVLDEAREQNQELMRTLEALRGRQAEVEHLNQELAETNRGVLALYAELDDRAQDLKRASEYKSRFLSDVSHEFRTPLTSVLNMTRLLLDRADGDLTPEQERQVVIIRNSVESLTLLVNDLLDLAKIEAGRTTLRASEFTVGELFAALRGMFRPLVTSDAVALVFEEAPGIGALHSDEQRVSQILRNLVSNAIKFTERGEVRVSAHPADAGASVRFVVRDTGIGIAPADQQRIFQDFTQVEGPIQRRVRGTGLGLPLARKLATLLGGHIELESELGAGSTFTLVVPRALPPQDDEHRAAAEDEAMGGAA